LNKFKNDLKYNKVAKRILIVEDEEITLNLLKRKLTEEGYGVFIARDGEEGLKLIRKIIPDLILLDILLPKIGGFEIMEEMAKEENLKKIPVIIFSNTGSSEELEKAKKLGARDWIIKVEFDPQKVIEKVVEQIGK